jgi:hypothetical protein
MNGKYNNALQTFRAALMDCTAKFVRNICEHCKHGMMHVSIKAVQKKEVALRQPLLKFVLFNLLWLCNSIHLKSYSSLCQRPSIY